MGLDMYACVIQQEIPAVDFAMPRQLAQIFYWRKHPDLHGWMERLYRAKGGVDDDFNMSPLRLDPTDLDALEKTVLANKLPKTAGFFFGVSEPEEKARDLEFIRMARDAIRLGKRVFYFALW